MLVTAGTVFEGTRKPLRTGFMAMWFVTNEKLGGSALELQRLLGLGSYQTAWSWLHKLRRAMVRPRRNCLGGIVEVDDTYIGGPRRGVKESHVGNRSIVVIALEVIEPRGYGLVRLRRIFDVYAQILVPSVQQTVPPGATVRTDGWRGYKGLARSGYRNETRSIAASGGPAHVLMPGVHRIAALLKKWLTGTHQGAAQGRHLDYYLDE